MREDKLFSRIKPNLDKWGSISRIENAVEVGMPDIFYCFEGMQGWVETKVEHNGKLYFEKFQMPWARRYIRAGAPRLFVMAALEGSRDPMALYDYSEVVKAPHYKERKWLVVETKDLEPLLRMQKPYDWAMLRLKLTAY